MKDKNKVYSNIYSPRKKAYQVHFVIDKHIVKYIDLMNVSVSWVWVVKIKENIIDW